MTTLIEFLVNELPKRGGWPKGAVEAYRHASDDYPSFYDGDGGSVSREYGRSLNLCSVDLNLDDDELGETVTREQYEAALAASKTEWDGEGLPPVGAEVECVCNELPNELKEKLLGHILYSGEYTILKTYKTNNQHHVPVESVFKTKSWTITPIRSEADKKKEEAVTCIMNQLLIRREVAEAFVKDISVGNIPHIRID